MSPGYRAGDRDPEQIADDIRHTRAEMSETIDAISARFEPQYIKEQVMDTVRETAHDARTSMLDTVRENPIPTLIAGLSIGWLLFGGSSHDRSSGYDRQYGSRRGRRPYRAGYPNYGPAYDPYGAGYDVYGTRGYEAYRTPPYAGGTYDADSLDGDEGEGLTDKARHAAEQVQERTQHAVHQASEHAHEWADDARYYGRRATNWLSRTMDENPLAVGAVALAAGALIGLAVPETETEHELMGDASDQLKRQARDMAGEKLEQAKEVAKAAAEEAKDKAQDVAEKARDEAGRQGLTDAPSAASGSGSASSLSSSASTPSTGSRSTPGGGTSTPRV